ncbi:MAG: FAD-dependent monooxygenase [Gammaproteobacteria bacterium]|nr:FAD-dependent monooxygenase [Gammaproteobacteria bacterium]
MRETALSDRALPESYIAVLGAGIGGLTAALALQRAGLQVRIFEQAPFLGDVGAGISVTPNAFKGLRHVGVAQAVEAQADQPLQQLTCEGHSGEILIEIDRTGVREQYGAPYLQLHRADLHAILVQAVQAADPDTLCLGRTCTGIEESSGEVLLHFAGGERERCVALIGADGLKSTVREQVFGAAVPDFSGFVAWRGLVPTTSLGDLPLESGSRVFVGPGRIFVRYPVRGGKLQNFVAFVRTGNWEAESWSQPAEIAELDAHFADWHMEVRALIGAAHSCHKWGLFAREPLQRWVTERVAVLGDAAHPMMPWFGQGAAMAIEDAVVIGRCFAAAPNDAPAALRRYQAARLERVTMIHREALLGGERLTQMDPEGLRRVPARNEDALGLFHYDPANVPI